MRVMRGRKWVDLGPRRGDALGEVQLQLRDGEIVGSISSEIITERKTGRPLTAVRERRMVKV